MKVFLGIIGTLCTTCAGIVRVFPAKLYRTRNLVCRAIKFHRFVTCKRCYKVYSLVDCVEKVGSQELALTCSHIPLGKRSRCNAPLLKTVELASNKRKFYPLMTYCYIDIHTALQILLHHKNFYEKCQEWKLRNIPSGTLSDIYDGKVWKDFAAKSFFDDCSFAFMFNCDWFQPYKHLLVLFILLC